MNLPSFTAFDIVLFVVITLLAVRCAAMGLVAELFSKAAVICGFIAALLLFRKVAPAVSQITGRESFSGLIAFLLVFLAVFFVIKIVQSTVSDIFFSLSLQSLDRALGLFLGAGEGLLVAAVVVVFLVQQPFFDASSILAGSFFAQLFGPISGIDLLEALPQAIKGQVASLL